MSKQIERDIKIDIISGKYKAISAYKIPNNPEDWEFNNGRSTACGCGENQYRNFSIYSESIMSWVTRHNGSALDYDSDKLRKNWNHWVETGEELETHESLRELGRW